MLSSTQKKPSERHLRASGLQLLSETSANGPYKGYAIPEVFLKPASMFLAITKVGG